MVDLQLMFNLAPLLFKSAPDPVSSTREVKGHPDTRAEMRGVRAGGWGDTS
jgi:hypothetical protein